MWIGGKIRNMNDLTCNRSSSGDLPISRGVTTFSDKGIVLGREPEPSCRSVNLAFPPENHRLVRATEPHRGLDERVKHRLQIKGRAADDLEDLAGGGPGKRRCQPAPEMARHPDNGRSPSRLGCERRARHGP